MNLAEEEYIETLLKKIKKSQQTQPQNKKTEKSVDELKQIILDLKERYQEQSNFILEM